MIQTIQAKIKTLLDTLDDVVGVYENPQAETTGYPYIYLTWEGNESELITNQEDRVTLIYKITMVQEKIEELKGRSAAEKTSRVRAWDIETLFRENNDLGLASVLRVLPVSTTKRYDASSTRIILETRVQVQILAEVKI